MMSRALFYHSTLLTFQWYDVTTK